jgi:NitT/TauT family transport system substrate-binding protein
VGNSVMKIIDHDFAREVFRVLPKYCASFPYEYIDCALVFIPALREMGSLARDFAKKE